MICSFNFRTTHRLMDSSISTAFLVLVVGMLTVFIVLLLVVLSGKMLIKLVNKLSYDKLDALSTGKVVSMPNGLPAQESSFNKQKLAVLISAVEIVTQGKGRISKIEKVK